MMTAPTTTPCTICVTKDIGILKCEGCSNVFCRKHVTEHRDHLRQQLDEIVHEHDQLYQSIHQTDTESHSRFSEIDQWEHNAIEKIQQVAQNIREEIDQQIKSQKEVTSDTLKYLSQRLRKACEDDDYVENDLRLWITKLADLKTDLTTISSSFILQEDSKVVLIANINLLSMKQSIWSSECFLRSVGDIDIEDNRQLAIHDSRKRSAAFLSGKNEYIQGHHTIRFIINKQGSNYITTFGIASIQSSSSIYGWNSDDQAVGCRYFRASNPCNQDDMKGETILQIEFIIDCDQRRISYLNERTGCRKEINIDLHLCPFPWQLYFYLYDTGDRVRLLASNRLS